MKKVSLIVGTRPEAIKMAPVFRALKKNPNLDLTLVSTGQHRELLSQALSAFGLKPDIDLALMEERQTLSSLNSRILLALENLFKKEKPDLILGHGDTTSCFAAALSSLYHSIPFFHVEAGLRTHCLHSPFPEEFNRQSIARIAQHHFAPSERERENLIFEGILPHQISVTGNTIHDSILHFQQSELYAGKSSTAAPVVITLHRRERGFDNLSCILQVIRNTAKLHPETPFIFPMHPNPTVKPVVENLLSGARNIELCAPLLYPDFLALLTRSKLVLTDSGGVQEEATFLRRRVFLLRESTERKDGLSDGLARLIGTNPSIIADEIHRFLSKSDLGPSISRSATGTSASERIAHFVSDRWVA